MCNLIQQIYHLIMEFVEFFNLIFNTHFYFVLYLCTKQIQCNIPYILKETIYKIRNMA